MAEKSSPRPCPFCAHSTIRTRDDRSKSGQLVANYCECEACGATGPRAENYFKAQMRWNQRREQPDLFSLPTKESPHA